MADVEIRFENENAEGLVAVGTYLSDAAKRFGVHFGDECDLATGEHSCAVAITIGADLLSEPTAAETAYLEASESKGKERLACQAKIERPGEIVVMTKKKEKAAEENKDQSEDYRKQFAELPLDKKLSELVQLESIALSETLTFVINSPYTIADKIMDVMAGFGFKMEKEKADAARPEEHRTNGASDDTEPKKGKAKKDEDQ